MSEQDRIDPGPAGVVAQRLRRERARNGWSAGDVVELLAANRCRMRRGAIKDIEDGKQPIKLNEAVALAQVLGVGLDNLLTPVEDLDNEEAAALANEAIASMRRLSDASAQLVAVLRGLATKSLGYEWQREISDNVQFKIEAELKRLGAGSSADARLAATLTGAAIGRLTRASYHLGQAAWMATKRPACSGIWVINDEGVQHTHQPAALEAWAAGTPLGPGVALDDAEAKALGGGLKASSAGIEEDCTLGWTRSWGEA